MQQAMNETMEYTQTHGKATSGFRFSLRTMFVMMAMVAAAMALFIHYGPLPGLIFAAIVVLGSWCYLRGRRRGMVVFVALYAALWVGLQFFGPYTSLRNRIVWVVGTERLREWADEVFHNLPPPDAHGRRQLDRDALPEDIQSIAGNLVNCIDLFHDGTDQIVFVYKRGFHWWIVEIDGPSFTRSRATDVDGVFDEITVGVRSRYWRWHCPWLPEL
ncbi:MAG: hypothetical protein ACYC3X_31980 [Pirellulaceae bacterium]